MTPVILESPLAGDVPNNERYARACMRDCLARDEAPFAAHLLYPQVLNDLVQEQRQLGMRAAQAWYAVAERCVVYLDLGCSNGMAEGILKAEIEGLPVEYRRLGKEWSGT